MTINVTSPAEKRCLPNATLAMRFPAKEICPNTGASSQRQSFLPTSLPTVCTGGWAYADVITNVFRIKRFPIISYPSSAMESFYLRDQQPYCITETIGCICKKIEFNSRRISLVHHHGRHSFV